MSEVAPDVTFHGDVQSSIFGFSVEKDKVYYEGFVDTRADLFGVRASDVVGDKKLVEFQSDLRDHMPYEYPKIHFHTIAVQGIIVTAEKVVQRIYPDSDQLKLPFEEPELAKHEN